MSLSAACRSASLLLFTCAVAAAQQPAQQRLFSSAHLEGEHTLPQSVPGGSAQLKTKLAARSGISLAVANFHANGVQDLVTGYAAPGGGILTLQRGNTRALAPLQEDWPAIAAGHPLAPFDAQAAAIEIPVRPDFLAAADVTGEGNLDLLVAAKGDPTLYLLAGDNNGNFAAPQAFALRAPLAALASWSGPTGSHHIAAAVCGASACGLQILAGDGSTEAFVSTSAVTALYAAPVNGGGADDLVLATANSVLILSGDTLLSASPKIDTIDVPSPVALTSGLFAYDRRSFPQIAVLSADATLHVFARSGIDNTSLTRAEALAARKALASPASRPAGVLPGTLPWVESETVANLGEPSASAILLRARLSGAGFDDLALFAGSQLITIAHPLHDEGALRFSTPIVTVDSSSAPVVAALPAHLSADARRGLLTLTGVGLQPLYTIPTSNRTMTVNSITDAVVNTTAMNACKNGSAGCTLRAAIAVSNADAGATGPTKIDTINIPTGTYTITTTNSGGTGTDVYGDVDYHYDVDAGANFVGAGCSGTGAYAGTYAAPTCSTIINANSKDKAFSINSTINTGGSFTNFDAYFSGLEIENAKDTSTNSGADYFGGAIDDELNGPGQRGYTNVYFYNNAEPASSGEGGGAVYVSNSVSTSSAPSGLLEFDTCTFSYNQTSEYGGALFVGFNVPFTSLSNYFYSNSANVTLNSSDTTNPEGGAVQIGTSGAASYVMITTNYFVSNSSNDSGGAIWFNFAGGTVTNSTFSANKAGDYGGAIYALDAKSQSSFPTNPLNITGSTFTTNQLIGGARTPPASSQAGAAVCFDAGIGTPTPTFNYNRVHGNTVSLGGATTGVTAGCNNTSYTTTVDATNNWWGCNPTTATNGTAGALSGTGCDTAAARQGSFLSVSPYTTLSLSLNTATPQYGTNLVATASLGQNNVSTKYTAAQDAAYLATPITTFTTTHTGTATYNPSATAFSSTAATGTSFAAATDSATTTSVGNGTATLTVDGQTVTQTYTVSAPDLNVASAHTGNFKAGDTADTYTLTVGNIGNASTSGTVTVTDTLPTGFTATAASGTNWTCSTGTTVTCTSSQTVAASVTYPAITVTVSVASTDAGTYTNNVAVSGGGEANTNNDTGTDPTIVVGQPTLAQAFSPTTVAPNATSTLTFTVGNPSANPVSLTGVAFSATLQTGLTVATAAATTCSGTATGSATSVSLSGATIAAGATCTVTIGLKSTTFGSYSSTAAAPTATNSNAGTAPAVATFTVNVTPTRLVYTNPPDTPITAGGNSGAIQVALEDAAGNVATNNSTSVVTLTVTATGYTTTTYTATASNGVANFSAVTLTLAGTYTYTASASGLTGGTSEVVNAGAFSALSGTGPASFTAPGQTGSITLKAIDSYGNTVTSFTGTVTLTSNDPLATPARGLHLHRIRQRRAHLHLQLRHRRHRADAHRHQRLRRPTQTGIVVNDCILFINSNGTLSRLTDAGIATSPSGAATPAAAPPPSASRLIATGDIWSVNTSSNVLAEFSKAGTALSGSGYTGGGLSAPNAVAIDGLGFVWVVNGNNTLSVFTNLGAAVSTATNYITVTGGTGSNSIAIDISGNLWISNSTNSTITEIVGGAAPTPPLAIGVANATTGTRP